MKRNNILSYILFALTALFPTMYVLRRLFLPRYTVLFDGWMLCADVLHIILLGMCITMLVFKDKNVGRVAKVLLILSMMLLPVGRFLLAKITEKLPATWESLLYLICVVVLVITVWFYVKSPYLMIIEFLVFSLVMGCSLFFSGANYIFAFEKLGDLADIPSPDEIHHLRVIEYADDDNRDWHHKIVYSYDSTHSFSVGVLEFIKDWREVEDFYEQSPPFDENTDIMFNDNGTITVKDKTYTYNGERVTEPPEPPL